MKKIIVALVATGFALPALYAQNNSYTQPNSAKDSLQIKWAQNNKKFKLEDLEAEKKRIEDFEKFNLKQSLDKINKQLENKEITADQSKLLKEDAAKNAALNIDNKLAIIEQQRQLAERENYWAFEYDPGAQLELGLGNTYDDNGSFLLGYSYVDKSKKVKYDKRTYGDVVLAGGLNNTFSSERSLKDSPYKIWKSSFAEVGFTFRTRLMKENNFLRLAYGASFQVHSLELTQNRYFAVDGDKTIYATAPEDLKEKKLRITNLVFPVYLEFGPSKKLTYYDKIRYTTVDNWKAGIGGYAGMNVGNGQQLRYYENGRKIQETQQRSFNTTNFIYGIGAYVGVGPFALYATYELNPLFKNGPVKENVFSLALRMDL